MPQCFGMSVNAHTPQYSQEGSSPQILEVQLSYTSNKCVHTALSWEKTETLNSQMCNVLQVPNSVSRQNKAEERLIFVCER